MTAAETLARLKANPDILVQFRHQMKQARLQMREAVSIRNEAIREMVAGGATMKETAAAFDLTTQRVSQITKGIPRERLCCLCGSMFMPTGRRRTCDECLRCRECDLPASKPGGYCKTHNPYGKKLAYGGTTYIKTDEPGVYLRIYILSRIAAGGKAYMTKIDGRPEMFLTMEEAVNARMAAYGLTSNRDMRTKEEK